MLDGLLLQRMPFSCAAQTSHTLLGLLQYVQHVYQRSDQNSLTPICCDPSPATRTLLLLFNPEVGHILAGNVI